MKKKHDKNLIIGSVLAGAVLLLIVVGYFWTPCDPEAMNASAKMQPPSWAHLLGTDNFGRDIFSRVLSGAGTTLFIAAATVAVGLAVGILVGAFTGYFGGWVDEVLMRINDVITAFPSILLALVLIEFARQKELDYVRNARLMGVGTLRIMFVHILPNVMPVVLSTVTIGFNNAVLAEAAMSYVGIGVLMPDTSLGRMLSESQSYFFSAPWYALSAGGTIVALILGFSLISEGLEGRSRA